MRWVKIAVLILLLGWYGAFLFHKIDLTTSDLGRHIINGKEVLAGNFGVLYENYYSYTEPDYPSINHHWLSGVIFYLIWNAAGFFGLHVFFVALSLAAFWLFFDVAKKAGGYVFAVPAAIFLIPLIAERAEVRPEIFSYLFSGIFLQVLMSRILPPPQPLPLTKGEGEEEKAPFSSGIGVTWALPFLMFFWANLHVYFFAGLLLIFIFMLWERSLWKIFLASLAAIFVTPFGLRAIALPLTLFQNYGYKIIENQSVWFLDNLGFIQNPNFFWFKIVAAAFILSLLPALFSGWRKIGWLLNLVALLFGIASVFAIRNFTIFGLFALPAIAQNLKRAFGGKIGVNKETVYGVAVIFSVLVLIIALFSHQARLWETSNGFGAGLAEANSTSAEFFLKENIPGPIFNNYDIGGYLIFYLYPKEKVFVDNRPEAYSTLFFENIYVPMQQDEKVWQKESVERGFNAIFFSHRDATPWGQKFLAERAKDPAWKVVFLDDYAIIFVKAKP